VRCGKGVDSMEERNLGIDSRYELFPPVFGVKGQFDYSRVEIDRCKV